MEFITLISSEANDIAEREAKKTIAAEHVTKALEELGFEGYVPDIKDEAAEHKEKQKVITILSNRYHFRASLSLLTWISYADKGEAADTLGKERQV